MVVQIDNHFFLVEESSRALHVGLQHLRPRGFGCQVPDEFVGQMVSEKNCTLLGLTISCSSRPGSGHERITNGTTTLAQLERRS